MEQKYDPQQVEKSIREFWDENNIFEKRREKNEGNEKWTFLDGPITPNFNMGIHHAYGRAYKDLYQRWKAMQGYDQRYQNGFDTQGLPIEIQAEKELGINSKKEIEEVGIETFIEKCKEIVEKYSKNQTEDSKKLGQWMDWENSYYTYKDDYLEHVWYFLKQCYERGILEEKTKILPWCTRCGTSLSQKEVSEGYTEMTHESVFVELPLQEEDANIMIWTTTPWTLTANVACAVHPDKTYALIEYEGDQFYMMKEAAGRVIQDSFEVVKEVQGDELIGKTYTPPFPDLPVQDEPEHTIISWDEVGAEEGTGIVHIAPGCGEEDWELGEENNLAVLSPLEEDGTYKDGYGWITGKNVNGIASEIISTLEEAGKLFKSQHYHHKYPLCWRCDEELVWRKAEGEWSIDQTSIRDEVKEASKDVNWQPEFLEKEYDDWVSNMESWDISRKRYWGTPLPIWKCPETGKTVVIGSKEELEEKAVEGLDDLEELHKPWIDDVKIEVEGHPYTLERVEHVADVWMDSGLAALATLRYLHDEEYFEEWYPANFVTEMREQVIKWFHTLMVCSVVVEGRAPYQNVMTYSEVIDDDGKPMSKSKGNAIWIDDAVENIGMDNVRWTYIKGNPNHQAQIGYESGEEAEKELEKLFNLLEYTRQVREDGEVDESMYREEDKWLLSKLNTVKGDVTEHLENLQPHKAAKAVHEFFEDDISRGYIQYTRERKEDEEEKKVVGYVLSHCLKEVLTLMAPMTPFVTEYLYKEHYGDKESIHLNDWPEKDESSVDISLEEDMEIVRDVIKSILRTRQKTPYNVRWPVNKVVIETDSEDVKDAVSHLADVVKRQTNTKKIEITSKLDDLEKDAEPNFDSLGPKFQENAQDVATAIQEKDGSQIVRDIEQDGSHKIELDDQQVHIEEDDIVEKDIVPERYAVTEEDTFTTYVDTERSEHLDEEGYVNEVMRQIQQLRKESGFVKQDRIDLSIETSQSMQDVLRKHEDDIISKVGATSLTFDETYEHEKDLETKGESFSITIQEH